MTILRHDRNPLRTADRKLLWLTNQLGYGLLYNWYTATDVRGITPAGCHVPSSSEFAILAVYLGGDDSENPYFDIIGGYLKEEGMVHWNSPNTGADNSTGFKAVGGGFRGTDGGFTLINEEAKFWNSESQSPTMSRNSMLFYDNYQFWSTNNWLVSEYKIVGANIRCLLTDPSGWQEGDTVTDYDGNVYPTCKIGTQVWMASNLKVKHYNNGEDIPNVTVNEDWAALTSGAWCVYDNDPKNM
jgi:uncharacterized protein (TIGR02145 family)